LNEDFGEFLEEKKINNLIEKIRNLFDIKLIYAVRKQRNEIFVDEEDEVKTGDE
jgi:hypothetical protein